MAGRAGLVEKIKQTDWYADWSGPFPLLEVSTTSSGIYLADLKRHFGKSFTLFLVLYREGIASARLPQREYDDVGEQLARKAEDPALVQEWSTRFKELAEKLTSYLKLSPREFLTQLRSLTDLYQEYGTYNVATKIVFNYLPADQSGVRATLEEARKYSETFYKDNAEMFSKIAELIASETRYPAHLVLMMTRDELYTYQETHQLPKEDELLQRYRCSGIYFDKSGIHILSAAEVSKIESFWQLKVKEEGLKGTVAYPGKVTGVCRIVFDYQRAKLKEGDILVTGMTDPNFVPLLRKVSAIVTDGGGLLSHAAIVSRELKKPCIVGTKIATQVLKDGDEVEVDADKGVVRILKKYE